MKSVLIFKAILLLSVFSCGTAPQELLIQHEDYELRIAPKQKSVLLLFPCYPCEIEHTKREAFFLDKIDKQGVTTILLRFNKKLYLTEIEKIKLSKEIHSIFEANKIKSDNVFLGGFSSGGNIALLLGDYIASQDSKLTIKGVFIVDSPVDLEQLYYNSKNDIALNGNEGAKSEGEFLANLLENELGVPSTNLDSFKKVSPFLASQKSLANLPNNKRYKIRLYTEPSIEWHQKNRKRAYENTNSWMIEKFYETLTSSGNTSCDLIKTENKGVRSNGEIHPHSWSIVEQKTLLEWLK